MADPTTYTHEEWLQRAEQLFGADAHAWRFVCPVCKHVAAAADWKAAGAPQGAVAFSCVGRWLPTARSAFDGKGPGPCNYTGGGLFALNPVTVVFPDGATHSVFDFAPATSAAAVPPAELGRAMADFDAARDALAGDVGGAEGEDAGAPIGDG